MIELEQVSFRYPDAPRAALDHVDLAIGEGELCLVVGETGSGKSTLLSAVNGLVPHFTGGTLHGNIRVDGRTTTGVPPRELAATVGVVGQDPAAGFVADTVEDELAYVMENLGIEPTVMRRRVEDALDLLGIAPLRNRAVGTLSSGEAQRVAIASVLTAAPRILVLDEPTSALDPGAAEDILAALTRLVHDLGLTILAAEHRLERIVQYADRVAMLDGHGRVSIGDPAMQMRTSPVAPPVVELGRLARWDPLPLSIRDARRAAEPLRGRLGDPRPVLARSPGEVVASIRNVRCVYGPTVALRDVDLDVREGEVVALMGRNGAGKSTLLRAIAGGRGPFTGTITVGGSDPRQLKPRDLIARVGLVPSDPSALLYEQTVRAECDIADKEHGLDAGTTRATLDAIQPGIDQTHHPRDISEGERLALALAVVLAPGPRLVLLDEPTRGLDYSAKARLGEILRRLASEGHGIVLATHDVELVASVADRGIVLADGEVVSDGPAREVVVHSPVFAPQVAKILAPREWLTVEEVTQALAG
ncbi:MAG TPA: ATP-binding cassette domain-containing protein [Acidimicrobiales bacterium]|nr:ATP-binding cassette domain-containing protein [Acidimicrobiales bacterium]